MELFKCSNYKVINPQKNKKIITPLGKILLDLHIEDEEVFNTNTPRSYKLENGGHVIEFVTDKYRAECLICRPKVSIPPHMNVDDCWAGVWRVQAFSEINRCCFSAVWENQHFRIEGGPNDGEDLACRIWTDSRINVAIGTEDGERLIKRAKQGDYLPKRLEKEIDPYSTIRQLSDRLEVPIKKLKNDEIVQIHFIVAWGKDDLHTWFAVDMTAQEILESQKCI
ncbi:MAG: hypothetical protein FH761_11315 [Firmicutes bacterium]|nr:hypothetical protein [Bacillota bacterium]